MFADFVTLFPILSFFPQRKAFAIFHAVHVNFEIVFSSVYEYLNGTGAALISK